jgi:hypothetical protein
MSEEATNTNHTQSVKPKGSTSHLSHTAPAIPYLSPRQSTHKFAALLCLDPFTVRDTSQPSCPTPPLLRNLPHPHDRAPRPTMVCGVPFTLTLRPGLGLRCGVDVEEGGEGWDGFVNIMFAVIYLVRKIGTPEHLLLHRRTRLLMQEHRQTQM